jgi:hypothetical protein
LLRSVLGWLRHFTPKLHYTNTAFYNGVMRGIKKQCFVGGRVVLIVFLVCAAPAAV